MQSIFGSCTKCNVSLNSENISKNGIRGGIIRYRKQCKKCHSQRVIASAAKDLDKRRAKATLWLRASGKVKLHPCERCSNPCYKHCEKAFCGDLCRFMSYVTITDTCWIWNGAKKRGGYGTLCFKDNNHMSAHRASYLLFRGEIPEGKLVCHNCPNGNDNPSCVNPDHLWIGTTQENTRDMVTKGRSLRGERHTKSKLTDEQIIKIRNLNKEGIKQTEIAEMFNVGSGHINNIIKHRVWKHI